MNKIKAICFDLDGVYFTPNGKRSFQAALSGEFGADPEKVILFMNKGHQAMHDLVRGKITNEKFFDEMRSYLGINKTNQEITDRWVRDYEIDQDVRKFVLTAKEYGYMTCVCTNNNNIRLSALENRFGFFKDFDVIVSSHMVGDCKPSKVIYQKLLDKLDVEPNELVYADDNPERIQGAIDLGITAFVFEDFEQFKEELKKFGVTL